MRSFAGRRSTIWRCSTLRPTPTPIHTHGRKRCCSPTVSGSPCTTPSILSWRGVVRCHLLRSTKTSAPPHLPLASTFSAVARDGAHRRENTERGARGDHLLGRRQTTLDRAGCFPDISPKPHEMSDDRTIGFATLHKSQSFAFLR